LIDYTPTARRHVDELILHFRRKRRPEAIRNLLAALMKVEAAIGNGSGRPREFPATYRDLVRPGRAWRKESIYWIAYDRIDPPVIVAVFWEGADLARRYPDVP
jgi:plasmid stabilization system protein ParE